MLKKYREEFFWDSYFSLVDSGRDLEAEIFYFKYSIITCFKYLIFMYIPFIIVIWTVIDMLCKVFL